MKGDRSAQPCSTLSRTQSDAATCLTFISFHATAGRCAKPGFDFAPGEMGENVTTSGIDLLGLPTGARLRLGNAAVIEVTGLRNPCHQLDKLREQG